MEGYLGNTDRWKGALGAVLVQGLLLWLLVAGLAVSNSPALRDKIALFAMAPDTQPPPPPPQPKESSSKEGAASPANLRSTATELVAPKPVVPPPPQVMAAAPVANTGVQSAQGAAPVPGPGTGAGGVGNGFGSGGEGDGDGDGGRDTPPRADRRPDQVRRFAGRAYSLERVGPGIRRRRRTSRSKNDGRVNDCRITRSSGNPSARPD